MSAAPGGILVDRELLALLGSAVRAVPGATAPAPEQVQPASVDLRLGPVAHRIRAGFLPERVPVHDRLTELATSTVSLEGQGAVLERGLVYLVPLDEELDLPPGMQGRFNPRSSSGRCDLFTRVLVSGHPRFDETPDGYRGRLWLEVVPLSFPVRLRRGDRLSQLRLQRGSARLTRDELLEAHERTPLCHHGGAPLAAVELNVDDDGALALRLGLEGRDPCGWRAARHTDVLRFGERGAHEREAFWEPVHALGSARAGGHCVLEPGSFYLFASRERFSIPPHLAAEMLPVDVGIGELRNNYAGFFDPGFGWRDGSPAATPAVLPADPPAVLPAGTPAVLPAGTPAVLEVRAHDVPFLVEDGQVFFRLRFFRTLGTPDRLYGVGRAGRSYAFQDLTLARAFREPGQDPDAGDAPAGAGPG